MISPSFQREAHQTQCGMHIEQKNILSTALTRLMNTPYYQEVNIQDIKIDRNYFEMNILVSL